MIADSDSEKEIGTFFIYRKIAQEESMKENFMLCSKLFLIHLLIRMININKDKLQKSLIFRAWIEPYEVYSQGITEWETFDEIKEFP